MKKPLQERIVSNPFLPEFKPSFVGLTTVEQMLDETEHCLGLLRAIGNDFNLRGDWGDTSRTDRDNDLYRRLEHVALNIAAPADLFDAIEAFDFLKNLCSDDEEDSDDATAA